METTQAQNQGRRLVFGPITVDNVKEGLNSQKKHQVQLRQIVTNIYPAVRTGNSLNDSLFTEEEFKLQPQSFEEKRVAFLPIPIGTTVEDVAARLKTLPNARLVKILSLFPILTDEQRSAMASGLSKKEDGSPMTEADYAEKQHIRTSEGVKVLYLGKYPQYRQTVFTDGKSGIVADEDNREIDLKAILADQNPIHMTEQVANATTVAQAKAQAEAY